MPRRRNTKIKPASSKSRPVKKSNPSIKKWNKATDIPLDEVDQFHSSRDKILLEGDDEHLLDEGDEDEVFALKGVDDEDDEAYDEEEDFDVGDEDAQVPLREEPKKRKAKKKKGKGEVSSDEEQEKEPEEESWGRGKAAYYNSNADELESDDEEGHELEEEEAKRLQSKAREHLDDEDFGLLDVIEVQNDSLDALEDVAPAVVTELPKDSKSLIRHLEKTNPEALALARDWEETADQLVRAGQKIKQIEAESPDALSLGMLHLHHQTLLSYTTTLAFYLHLRATEKYTQRPSLLQSHPIMSRLLTLKQALITLEELDFAGSDDEDDGEFSGDSDDMSDVDMKWDDILKDGGSLWDEIKKQGLDRDELADLLKDAEDVPLKPKRKHEKAPPKKKRKVDKTQVPDDQPVFDLEEPEFVTSKKATSRKQITDDSYGEASYLQDADAADKSARKKTLRFHTSKIESASARRQSARNEAVGGDDDIPYRERQKQKDKRMDLEAKKRLEKQGGADLDDVDPELPTEKRKREDSDDDSDDSPDEYYELVKKKSKQNKENKKTEYEAIKAASKPDFAEEDMSGPRSLTRAILKNRGLTPHRSKSVRNPRVKKRQRYDKAKKKLSSQKATFRGGLSESGGRYEGERSGISKVVKSVRLGQ